MPELAGLVAAADHDHALRQFGDVEDGLRGGVGDIRQPGYRRNGRSGAGGDDDLGGADRPIAHLERPYADELASGRIEFQPGVLFHGLFHVAAVPQHQVPGPPPDEVKIDVLHLGRDADPGGVADLSYHVRRVDPHLGGDTSAVEAGASQGSVLDQSHLLARIDRLVHDVHPCPGTDDYKVVLFHLNPVSSNALGVNIASYGCKTVFPHYVQTDSQPVRRAGTSVILKRIIIPSPVPPKNILPLDIWLYLPFF